MAKIWSQLERAQLENLSSDPSPGIRGRVWLNTASGLVKYDDGTTVQSILISSINVMPPGAIVQYGAASAPTGWLLCDGSAVSRVTYVELFDVIGVIYGIGDGANTFNLPDMRGRTALGANGQSPLTGRSLGDKFGTETHTLVTGEIPGHTHGITDPGHNHPHSENPHTHGISPDGIHNHSNGSYNRLMRVTPGDNTVQSTDATNSSGSEPDLKSSATMQSLGIHSHGAATVDSTTGITNVSNTTGITTISAGGGTAHNNMQPNLVLNFIIKT